MQGPQAEEDLKEDFITFAIKTNDGLTKPIRKKISRWVRIKKKTGGHIRRPTVMMQFWIAGQLIEEEVNLSDRDDFIYDVLIGRNMLKKGNLVVDSAQTFTAKPKSSEAKGLIKASKPSKSSSSN